MRPLCVIPARRDSKRLPLKNIRPLNGQPMLTYTVRAALDSGVFDTVYVSTEDSEIAAIAEGAGAVAHPRPDELAGDLVSATGVCLDLEQVLRNRGEICDAIVCLQPSSPLRSAEDIRGSWQHFVAAGAHYLVSVTAVDPHYFHWAVWKTEDGWRMYFGDQYMDERPLLPPVYRPNGAIKIGKIGPLRATRNFFGKPLEVYIMPEQRSVHVAEQFDFDLAQYLMGKMNKLR
ncbi:MAG: cytidylyltransferase domain-containing protein [Burkholderiales bacterium]